MTKQADILTEKQFALCSKVASAGKFGLRNNLAINLGWFAGLRAKEICSLKISDCFMKNGEVVKMVHLTKEQSKSHSRTFVANSKLAKILSAYYVQMGLSKKDANSPLLVSNKGSALSAHSTVCVIKKVLEDANLAHNRSSHSFRRSFCTKLISKGVNSFLVCELMGHRNVSTTQLYFSANPVQLQEIAELA
ncbi:tyrosine-type recombinase/integrase [Colwellia piezophila]|uniref:tyrosine-type recombinase/integrase n=1 Tax=Colwellia piezophila TaxID=211668 RepID=UPI0003692ADD|nr:site-specific integrase [Colwellia piezophila]